MPEYYEEGENEADVRKETSNEVKASNIAMWKPLLILTFFYYLITCGVERIYQPMVRKNDKFEKFKLNFCKNTLYSSNT